MSDTSSELMFTCHTDMPWTPSKFAQGVEVKNLGKANGRAIIKAKGCSAYGRIPIS